MPNEPITFDDELALYQAGIDPGGEPDEDCETTVTVPFETMWEMVRKGMVRK